MFVIIAGEMRDVDYCHVYGPYTSEAGAEADVPRLIASGKILVAPDDCLDWRVMKVNP